MEATDLGLPNQSVGVGVTQPLHHFVDSGAYLLRIRVPSVDHLQQRKKMAFSHQQCKGLHEPQIMWWHGVSPGPKSSFLSADTLIWGVLDLPWFHFYFSQKEHCTPNSMLHVIGGRGRQGLTKEEGSLFSPFLRMGNDTKKLGKRVNLGWGCLLW
jgi:hypothetical protein